MIKVTRVLSNESAVTLRVEGSVRGPDLEELRRECRDATADGTPLVVDLSGVSFMDAAGAEWMRQMRAQGARLTGCRGLVDQLLRR